MIPIVPCLAKDVSHLRQPCQPVEGRYDGGRRWYCAHCGRRCNVQLGDASLVYTSRVDWLAKHAFLTALEDVSPIDAVDI